MIPRLGRPPRPGTAYRRRPGAYAILAQGGRLLLTVQETEAGPEVQLPGGGVDPGEHPLGALRREVREETGHAIGAADHVGTYREFAWMPEYGRHAEKVCAVYAARPALRLHPPTEPGHSVLWLRPEAALTALAGAGNRRMLASWLRRRGWGAAGILR